MQPHPGRTLCGGEDSVKLSVKFGEPRLKVGFSSKPFGVKPGTPIIRGSGDLDPYTGEYTVTPSSEVQTLQTRGLRMTDDVTVNPIPDIRTSDDLTANGAIVTAPAGYYASDASKAIPDATLKSLGVACGVPTISVDGGGLITATATSSPNVNAQLTEDGGYVAPYTNVRLKAFGGLTATEQLSTQGAATITPSTSSQIAVAAGKYTTGDIIVNPIPSDYGRITWDGSVLTVS